MNTSDFTSLLQHPQDIDAGQTDAVKSIIDEFPYFQSARAIYLKGLKNSESYRYNQELKIAAAYTTDRSVLFDFITSEAFEQNETAKVIQEQVEHIKDIEVNDAQDLSVAKSIVIDEALRQHIKDTEPILDPDLFREKVQDAVSEEPPVEPEPVIAPEPVTASEPAIAPEPEPEPKVSPEEKLEIGKPLTFDKSEIHSFAEWLKLTRFKPIDREEQKDQPASPDSADQSPDAPVDTQDDKARKFELIDKFISAKPKIQPPQSEHPMENLAKAQMLRPDSLMTETLARIYVEQKNYEKAIKAYNILSLKYPEKSGFFADRIKALKELQEQNKNKK